ncbi:MAG TPA: hypothetical protein VIC62_18365, partial [Nakamurella sp.]
MTTSAVEAVVLDMDGLLIDTEPVWRSAESAVFAGLGIPLSESDVLGSTGQPIEELIPVWRQRSREDGPSDGGASGGGASGGGASGGGASGGGGARLTDAEVAGLVVDRVIAHVRAEGQPMPGV